MPHLYAQTASVLGEHRKRNPFRIHKHFYHMASSQAANLNLFLPVLHHRRASDILRAINPDVESLDTDQLDSGYCIEYWGGNYQEREAGMGLLGDKTKAAGTDTDIAIAYRDHDGNSCLWLIEHKLTEHEFTTCGASKSRGRKPCHDCDRSYADILENPFTCYYHDVRKFNYWRITDEHRRFFPGAEKYTSCPFRGGMNQLWRNMLLALAIEQSPEYSFKKVTFSVVRHPRNDALMPTMDEFEELVGHSSRFSHFTSGDVVRAASSCVDSDLDKWVQWYTDLYGL
ncbi:hypothetical protein P4B35_20820 [Pontiellaceae bacterium B12227]|nr:hypothetical protein [Pontiellaceae bacterium B12227]